MSEKAQYRQNTSWILATFLFTKCIKDKETKYIWCIITFLVKIHRSAQNKWGQQAKNLAFSWQQTSWEDTFGKVGWSQGKVEHDGVQEANKTGRKENSTLP